MEWIILALLPIAGFLVWRSFRRAGDTPKAGDAAPGFSLPDQHGATHSLTDFRDNWLVLYFFPRADEPG